MSPPPPMSPAPPNFSAGSWRMAELAAGEVLRMIQPTPASEATRSAIIAYLQSLFRDHLGIEVLSLGSVPLKTYLPDGDIDLTAVGRPDSDFDIATDICSILEMENRKEDAMFKVKDVHYIQAEPKHVRCSVQNIVVDISFNQIGGVCTLRFLEQIAHYLGKENLFKRSIILIKGWSYYESRILGVSHGLFSTYALQTLVLYIILHFHSSLDGPFAVMYKFLDYFSKFNWEKYCVSLCGPALLCKLPRLVVERLDNNGGDIMFTMGLVKNCLDMIPVSMRTSGNFPQVFCEKFLNIVDPLREGNNLGRSVSKSSSHRICGALEYGARKLGEILSLPEQVVADEMFDYFMDTLGRHRSRKRPDVVGDLYGSPFVVPLEHNSFGSSSSDLEAQKGKRNYFGLAPGLSFPFSFHMVEDAQKHQGTGTYLPQKDHCNKRKNSDKRACSQLPRAYGSHFAAGLVAIPGTKLDTAHESSWQSIPMVNEDSHDKLSAQFGSLGFVPMQTAPPYTHIQFGSLDLTATRSQLMHPQQQGFWQVPTSRMQVGGNSYCGSSWTSASGEHRGHNEVR